MRLILLAVVVTGIAALWIAWPIFGDPVSERASSEKLWRNQGEAGGGYLQWNLVDAVTGADLGVGKFALLDSDGQAYARSMQGSKYAASPAPREGDTLVVLVTGYEVGLVTVRSTTPAEIRLNPALGKALIGPTEPPGRADTCRVEVRYLYRSEAGGKSLVASHLALGTLATAREFPVPASLETRTILSYEGPGELLAWPVFYDVKHGERIPVHVDALPAVGLSASLPEGEGPEVWQFWAIPDYSFELGWDPKKIDAYLWQKPGRRDGSGWSESKTLLHRPPVPHHLFGLSGLGRAGYGVIPGRASEFDLPLGRAITIQGLPTIDGKPARNGTIFMPGKLSLSGIQWLLRERAASDAFTHAITGEEAGFRLPSASVLTAWHPEHGIAYCSIDSSNAVVGRTSPGSLLLTAPPDARVTGTLKLSQQWVGDGAVATVSGGPPVRSLQREPTPIRIGGLPEGSYSVGFTGQVHLESGEERSIDVVRLVKISDRAWTRRVVLLGK